VIILYGNLHKKMTCQIISLPSYTCIPPLIYVICFRCITSSDQSL